MPNRVPFRLAVSALIVLHGICLFAGFLSPYDPTEQNRALPFNPPMKIHFFDERGVIHLRPFVYDGNSAIIPLQFFVGTHLFGVDQPARIFLLGSDDYGRDQFSRLLHGGRISLLGGWIAATLSLGIGLVAGTFAAYRGGWWDEAVMRLAELFLALPWLYLLLAVRAFLPLAIDPEPAFLLVTATIGVIGWARPARLVRSAVLEAKERAYVLAARSFGAGNLYLVIRHILPETRSVVLTQAAILVPLYMLAEVALSYLGLGVGEPAPSWGSMLASLRQYHVLTSFWWMAAPGLFLVPLCFCFHICADALAESSSPC